MAIGDSAGILFRIKADGDQATSEIKKVKGDINELGNSAKTAGSGFASLAGPAAAAATAVATVGTAAIAAAVQLFNLTKAAADYGSAIFDASQKTGASAETISALKYAADTSGSSLENISGSLAKFNVLLGEANQGNEKANDTLEKYGVTARTVDEALVQSIASVAAMTTADQQAIAAKELFKDRTAEILPVIKSFDGDLPGLISKLEELGLVMSDEDARAADEFGDTLDTLNAQADALGRQFATELMPLMVSAMQSISQAMSENKGIAREWGGFLVDTANGVSQTYGALRSVFTTLFSVMTLGMSTTQQQAGAWGSALRIAAATATAGVSELIIAWSKLGQIGASVGALAGGSVNIPDIPRISLPPGGGGGGGRSARGGGGGRDNSDAEARRAAAEAERQRKALIADAELVVRNTLEIYAAGNAERIAQLDLALAQGLISEKEHIRDVARVRQEAIQDEIRQTESLLINDQISLNDEERAEILQKLKVLAIELRVERLKGSEAITKQIEKETKAQEKLLEAERKRLQTIKEQRQLRDFELGKERLRRRIEEQNEERNQKENILGRSILTDLEVVGDMEVRTTDLTNAFEELESIGGSALQGLAQGLGSVIENFILMGDTGPNAMRKLVAGVLAGVSAQAAVLAIMELAYGIAALTPWGAAIYGPAVAHFKAAALFGAVALGAGIAGRAAAGDSFSKAQGSDTKEGPTVQGRDRGAFSRESDDAYTSGRPSWTSSWTQAAVELKTAAADLKGTAQHLKGVRPGEVLTRGMAERPGAIGNQVVNDIKRNATLGRELRARSGSR